MRKSTIVFGVILLVLAGAAAFLFTSPFGLSIGGTEIGGSERAFLAARSVDFLEDIQFKDFKKASTYHLSKTQAERDIPELIRRVFAIKHEALDIREYRVADVDIDRAKTRGRVRMNIRFRILGDMTVRDDPEALRDADMMLYWFRQPDGTWTMELESSLR